MEQKDYLQREIEKIGAIIGLIREKFFKKDGNIEKQLQNAKEVLQEELDFDFDRFLSLSIDESYEYISRFTGFNVANIEQLADLTSQIGFSSPNSSKIYLQKALQLYFLCSMVDKAYSYDREDHIAMIKDAL